MRRLASHIGKACERASTCRLEVRVAKRERFRAFRHAAQHGVSKATRLGGNGTYELNALVNNYIGGLVEEQQLIGAHAHSVANDLVDVVRGFHVAVNELVERADRRSHATRDFRGVR